MVIKKKLVVKVVFVIWDVYTRPQKGIGTAILDLGSSMWMESTV